MGFSVQSWPAVTGLICDVNRFYIQSVNSLIQVANFPLTECVLFYFILICFDTSSTAISLRQSTA